MMPKFKIHEGSDGRFSVETDWYVVDDRMPAGTRVVLMVTTGGKLSSSGVTWSTRAKAEENIERCKARLR